MANPELDNIWQSLERELHARRSLIDDSAVDTIVPPELPQTRDAALDAPPPLNVSQDSSIGHLAAATPFEAVAETAPVIAAAPRPARFSSFNRTSAAYAAAGFVAGMFAWHIVGFWGFVAEVVLHHPASTPTQVVAAAPPIKTEPVEQTLAPGATSNITTGSIPPTEPTQPAPEERCITAERGNTDAHVAAADCRPRDALRDGGVAARTDRLPSAGAPPQTETTDNWAQGTGIETPAAEAAASPPRSPASTLTAKDVNLNLGAIDPAKIDPN